MQQWPEGYKNFCWITCDELLCLRPWLVKRLGEIGGGLLAGVHRLIAAGSLRELLASNSALARKVDELERKYKHHEEAITAPLSAIRELTHPPATKRWGIGFTADIR